ncbi:toll/interleukin-1 receptor domain-containing protein [Streptomyces spongiae]|uniref:toll/interleukin-1 receptor domain-containing protein n=1 Tax=Streptomyces spongiae TaxID=565072 RepID=UPI001883F1FB|nr:toll/interleukin-1 receptor domain-containing protein [Streptomyces spongiae]
MSSWHASNSAEWTPVGDRMLTGHGGGIGPYAASYAIDLTSGPVLNGSVSADILLTGTGVTGAGLVCRADRDWTFVAFYTAPQDVSEGTTVARLGVFQEGVLTPVAQLAEPVELERGYNHFSLEFFSGQMRGEIRAGDRTYELTAACPHVPFAGHAGLVKFYGAGVLATSWSVERTRIPFVPAASRRKEGQVFQYDVFLCHARETAQEVHDIAQALKARGISYWLDTEQITYGDRVTEKIEEGLRNSHYVLPCISKGLMERSWCRAEYGGILNAELSGDSTRIVVPLMLAAAEPDDIPLLFRDKRRVTSTNRVEFDRFIDFLLSN